MYRNGNEPVFQDVTGPYSVLESNLVVLLSHLLIMYLLFCFAKLLKEKLMLMMMMVFCTTLWK